MYIHIHTYICIYIYIHIHIHIYICVCMCVCVCMCLCSRLCMCACRCLTSAVCQWLRPWKTHLLLSLASACRALSVLLLLSLLLLLKQLSRQPVTELQLRLDLNFDDPEVGPDVGWVWHCWVSLQLGEDQLEVTQGDLRVYADELNDAAQLEVAKAQGGLLEVLNRTYICIYLWKCIYICVYI